MHLRVRLGEAPKEGTSAGVTMVAAPVSGFTGRPVRGLAMNAKSPSRPMLALGGIAEKVLAARRGGLGRVLLPLGNPRHVDEDLDDGLRRAVVVDYVTRTEELGRSGPAS